MIDSHATFKDLKGNLIGTGTLTSGKINQKGIEIEIYKYCDHFDIGCTNCGHSFQWERFSTEEFPDISFCPYCGIKLNFTLFKEEEAGD